MDLSYIIMKPYLGFWETLERPFFVLAPMANVTDAVFRRIITKYSKYGGRDITNSSGEGLPAWEGLPAEALRVGGPDVTWTEFVSADGLCHPKGREALLRDLWFTEGERPIVAQLFTAHPEKMFEAAKLVASLGFDGIDINMGCPDKNVMKQGAGAACMKNPELAQKLIIAAREGTISAGKELPISVKTRLGFNEDSLEALLPKLLEAQPAVITVHARTKKEMSKVPARWERVKRAVEIAAGSGTFIIGNGDVKDLADAEMKARETGADGVMLGRAIFGNPWLFADVARVRRGCHSEHPASSLPFNDSQNNNLEEMSKNFAAQSRNRPIPPAGGKCAAVQGIGKDGAGLIQVTVGEKLKVALEHTKLFEEVWKNTKSFELMKKHYQAYINHFPQAKELRVKLMMCHSAAEVERVIAEFLQDHPDIARQDTRVLV